MSFPWINIIVIIVSECRGTFQTYPAVLTGVWDSKVSKIFLKPIKIIIIIKKESLLFDKVCK